jgi:acetyl-CoA carboxylase carboxyltransferase component
MASGDRSHAVRFAQIRPLRYILGMREMSDLIREIREQEVVIRQGGESDAQARQRSKGRLTARERVELLLDSGSQFFELAIFAGKLGNRGLSRQPRVGTRSQNSGVRMVFFRRLSKVMLKRSKKPSRPSKNCDAAESE